MQLTDRDMEKVKREVMEDLGLGAGVQAAAAPDHGAELYRGGLASELEACANEAERQELLGKRRERILNAAGLACTNRELVDILLLSGRSAGEAVDLVVRDLEQRFAAGEASARSLAASEDGLKGLASAIHDGRAHQHFGPGPLLTSAQSRPVLERNPAAGLEAGHAPVDEGKARADFARSGDLQREFGTEGAYLAWLRVEARGRHKS